MVETTLASISSSVSESTGKPTEIAIRASTSTSFAMSDRRFLARDGLPLSSVKNFFLRRRFFGGGPGSVRPGSLGLGFWGGSSRLSSWMGSEEVSSRESETGASGVVLGGGE